MAGWLLWPRSSNYVQCEKSPRKSFIQHVLGTPISMCFGMLLFAVIFFILTTLDPGKIPEQAAMRREITGTRSGRTLHSVSISPLVRLLPKSEVAMQEVRGALHGMGTLFRKGSRAMNELVVAHLVETTEPRDLRMFLRTLHRSGVTARADVVLLFPRSPIPKEMKEVIEEEEESFRKLMKSMQSKATPHATKKRHGKSKPESSYHLKLVTENLTNDDILEPRADNSRVSNSSISFFNYDAFWRAADEGKVRGQLLWENITAHTVEAAEMAGVTWGDWGSIVGFEMQELDTNEVLKGFLEKPPVELQRWFCYQMLLGMVKQKYRSVLLTEVQGVVILGDVLTVVRKKLSGLYLPTKDQSWSDERVAHNDVPVIAAGSTGTRRRNAVEMNSQQSRSTGGDDNDGSEDRASDADMELGEEIAEEKNINIPSPDQSRKFETDMVKRVAKYANGFVQVYGEKLWRSLEKEDKERAVINSGFLMGTMKPIRSLTNAMATEIVRVALDRKNREPFGDICLLNYLLHKSSVLGKKITEKVAKVENRDGAVHILPASKQSQLFTRGNGTKFAALQGFRDSAVDQEKANVIVDTIHDDICSSDAKVYSDCHAPGFK